MRTEDDSDKTYSRQKYQFFFKESKKLKNLIVRQKSCIRESTNKQFGKYFFSRGCLLAGGCYHSGCLGTGCLCCACLHYVIFVVVVFVVVVIVFSKVCQ